MTEIQNGLALFYGTYISVKSQAWLPAVSPIPGKAFLLLLE